MLLYKNRHDFQVFTISERCPMNKSLFRALLLITVLASQAAFFDFSPPAGNPGAGSPLDNIKRISRSTYLIQHEYYDTSRILPLKMFQEGLHEMAKDIPELLPKFENDKLLFQIGTKSQIIETSTIKKLNDILMPTSQVFALVKSQYKGDIKMEDIEYAFIGGMLSILDPHSSILPPKAFEEFKAQTQGEYGGLGIVIGLKDEELTVIAPIESTPAWRAGIQTDDKILQIGEQATTNMSLNDAVDMMRGKPGSAITLRIKSKNIDAHDVVLTREVIVIESVQSSVMNESGKSIGVLRVKGFQEDTFDDMVKQLDKMKEANPPLSGIILDLRGNPGGLLDQAIMIADKFLQGGDIVYTVGADNKDQEVAIAQKQDGDVTLPLIVLVNEGSASASEIVAGALKNNNRAIIMGTQSFGKGSVQSVFGLRDGSSVKLTIAQYLTPGRVSIQAIGIIPDLHLYPAIINDDFFDIIEDAHYGEEKLDSHLENKTLLQASLSAYNGTYLVEKNSTAESEYVSKIKTDDYLLKLAAKLFAQIKDSDKPHAIEKMKATLDKETKAQDDLITAALAKKSIDWTDGPEPAHMDVTVSHIFVDNDGKPVTAFKGGTEVFIKTTLQNKGNAPLFRVIGDLESQSYLLNHREIVFGKIDAGASVTRESKIKIPDEAITLKEEVILSLFSGARKQPPVKSLIAIEVEEKPRPQFAFSYVVHDGDAPESTGNKNGVPEKSESIVLDITLKNIGTVSAGKTTVNIKNDEGDQVFLKQARETINELKPGETVTKSLKFNVKDGFAKDKFGIDFFAFDNTTRASIMSALKFDIKTLKPETAKPNDLIIPPVVSLAPGTLANSPVYPIRAIISDSQKLKDIWVSIRGKKVFYLNLEQQNLSKKDLSLDLPLEDGQNQISVVARNSRDLMSGEIQYVVYHKDKTQFVTK